MKSIIIAAGKGTRLKSYTSEIPKCMLEIAGKTLLQHQLDIYRSCGIIDISVVRGYRKEKINYPDITYYDNDDYENNNILNSLFYAEAAIDGPVVISYSDIIFEEHVVQTVLRSTHDISIVVDTDWQHSYKGRSQHPLTEAESVTMDTSGNVLEIGKIVTTTKNVHGEFIGMLRLSPRGAKIFKQHFHRSKTRFLGKPFQRAAVFEMAYITDMLQEMTDLGVQIHCVIIERGWKEIDTIQDYEEAASLYGRQFNNKLVI